MLSMVSAFQFDNVLDKVTTTFDGKEVKDYPLLEKYSPIKISNAFDLPLIGNTLFEGYLSQHTNTCGDDCESIINIKHHSGSLIDDIRFIGEQPKSYNIKIVKVGEHIEEEISWKDYNIGNEIEEGIYRLRISGKLNLFKSTDWQIKVKGIWIDSWAVWDSSTISYYKLDETSGTSVSDVLGISSGTTSTDTWAAGKINNGFNFTPDNTMNISYVPDYNLSGKNFTISLWFTRDSWDSDYPVVFGKEDETGASAGMDIHIGRINTAAMRIYMQKEEGDYTTIMTSSVEGGGWFNLVFGYNGTGSFAYMNNILQGYDEFSGGITNGIDRPFRVGYRYDGHYWDGIVDEIGIWDRALTTLEISELWNGGDGLAYSPPNYITYDSTNYTINCANATINYPIGTIDYLVVGQTLNINYSCDASSYLVPITLTTQQNFTVNNETSSRDITWITSVLENNRTYNLTSYETAGETFTINVKGPTTASLFYNNTEYTTTKLGEIFTKTLQIPIGQLGNNSVYWKFDGTQNSYTSYQNISETIFTLCNTSYQTRFLNISFKDESDSSIINASIPTSTFDYWLGSGSVKKTYTFINTTENFNYEFCATPNRTLHTDIYIQYKQGSAYPQRTYDEPDISLTNTTTNLTLYLLGVSDGLYVTFQVTSGQSSLVQGADVTATRVIGGVDTTVAQGTTDSAGTVTFWLNPDFVHTFTFSKTGFVSVVETITPTQTFYTINMGEAAAVITNEAKGVVITTFPQGSFLDSDTIYIFNYTINSTELVLDEFGFELFYNNGTSIFSDSSTVSTGGTLTKSFNTSNETRVEMTYYYITNSTRINGTTYWLIYDTNDFSIFNFFTRVGTYISANIFGILGDDEGYFAKAVISILVLILVTGTISMRYGIGSESAVTGLLFGVTFMLNMFDLIPTPPFLTFIELGDFLVFIIAIVAISTIIKEEGR